MSERQPPPLRWLVEQYVQRRRSASELATETGWSSQFIRDRLRSAGVTLRPPGAVKPAPLEPAVLARWLAEGVSVPQVAARAGYSRRGVYKLIRAHGLTPRPPAAADLVAEAQRRVAAECGQLYREGLTLGEVGARFGRGPHWARARVVQAGVPLRPGGTRGLNIDVGELRDAVAGGASVAELAARYGRSDSVVRDWLRAGGIVIPPRKPSRTGPILPVLDGELLHRRYVQQRATIAQIAAELGVSTDRVRKGLSAAGIRARQPGRGGDVQPVPIRPDELRQLYLQQGLSASAVGARLGVSTARVLAALHRHAIPVRKHTRPRTAPLDVDAGTLRGLYVGQGLDDAAIADRYGVPTHRVRQLRRRLGVHRDPVPPPHPAPPAPPERRQLARLYSQQGRTLSQIARRYHTSSPVVRSWLDAAGIEVKPRTGRVHRTAFDIDQLRVLYLERQWSATEIAAELDTTVHLVLRALHDHAIPVRHAGARRRLHTPDDDGQQLLADLYADPDVTALLAQHRLPARSQPGTITDRFPTPLPVTEPLLADAYLQLGLSARHLELLTGQPAGQILDALHAAGIPVRGPGLSPWLTRRRGN